MTNSYVKTAGKMSAGVGPVPVGWPPVGGPWPTSDQGGPRAMLRQIVDKASSRIVAAAMALIGYEPKPAEIKSNRTILPMSSGVNILPNTSAQVTSRPQATAFRPERIVIGGTPGDWLINDIKVGNRSQLVQAGDLPGELFAFDAIDNFVRFETVQTAMDFVILVTYVGKEEAGAPFVCGVMGTAVI